MLYKSKQACAYADDIALIARNLPALEEMVKTIERAGKSAGLVFNVDKTKYMKTEANNIIPARPSTQFIKISNYKFEKISNFTYLGVKISNKGLISEEINNRIILGNRAYYANLNLIKSRLLTKSTKVKLYKTLIRPVVSYAAETWTLNNGDENALRIFERKIMRRIYGPICESGLWRIRSNIEIDQILKGEDIVRFIKSLRISWLGHVERMGIDRTPKNLLHNNIIGVKRKGRPRKRWLQDVEQDLSRMGIRGWREKAQQRDDWRRIVRETKAHKGL